MQRYMVRAANWYASPERLDRVSDLAKGAHPDSAPRLIVATALLARKKERQLEKKRLMQNRQSLVNGVCSTERERERLNVLDIYRSIR